MLVVAMVAFHAGFRGSNPGALGERAQRNNVLAGGGPVLDSTMLFFGGKSHFGGRYAELITNHYFSTTTQKRSEK